MNENENKVASPDERLIELGVPAEKVKSVPKRKRSAAALGMEKFGKEKTAGKEKPAPEEEANADGEVFEQGYEEYISALLSECSAFERAEPLFSAEEELKNPKFAYLTSPAVGLRVAEAFYAIHGEEFRQKEIAREKAAMEYSAKETARRIAAAGENRRLRPTEGAITQSASLSAFDYASATPKQREAFKNRIRLAAANGEKIFP